MNQGIQNKIDEIINSVPEHSTFNHQTDCDRLYDLVFDVVMKDESIEDAKDYLKKVIEQSNMLDKKKATDTAMKILDISFDVYGYLKRKSIFKRM